MPEAFLAAAATPGLGWLIGVAALAGLVYGFTGFGAALIFMPLAAMIVPPERAVAALAIASCGSFLVLVPDAWRRAGKPACVTMLGAALVMIPAGVWVLVNAPVEPLRWGISVVVLATLAALLAGWSYTGAAGRPAWLGVGGAVGFMAGSTGLNGPVLVLFQLAGPDGVDRSRANTIVVLTTSSVLTIPILAWQGVMTAEALALGLMIFVPFAGSAWIGRRLFDPGFERLYRAAAYTLVGAAGILGLPLFG